MTFRRTITGNFAAFSSLQAEIIAAVERLGFGESRLFDARLRVEEALIDALKRFASGTKLYVQVEITDEGTKVAVREAE